MAKYNSAERLEEIVKYTALVMAASRRGAEDPVAKIQGLSHKCLVVLDGKPMIQRVIETLLEARAIARVAVSIEDPAILRSVPALANLLDQGRIVTVPSEGTLYHSVIRGALSLDDPYPLVITTADNALHTAEMIDFFCSEATRSQAEVLVGLTRANDVLAAYPDGLRAFHRLRDQGYSSCNLYCIRSEHAVHSAKAFEGGGQFGKKPRRILKAFGLRALLFYKLKLFTLQGFLRHLSRRSGLELQAVIMPFPEAPIDVDNAGDFALTERILRSRRAEAA